ncbi:MAG: hypothetical protein K2Y12_00425 [Chitinophagaceae bacterium]|nr:hypothetical protein [Chitinophagaceae bacterium]
MKQLFAFIVMLLSASFVNAQDIISLRSGETINGKVAEVGTTEIRYYKSSNINGPVYVVTKTDISQIVYENGSKDIFTAAQQPATVIVQQPVPQTVYVEQPVRRRNFWNSGFWYPVVTTHIDLGHHGGFYGGHHRRHH